MTNTVSHKIPMSTVEYNKTQEKIDKFPKTVGKIAVVVVPFFSAMAIGGAVVAFAVYVLPSIAVAVGSFELFVFAGFFTANSYILFPSVILGLGAITGTGSLIHLISMWFVRIKHDKYFPASEKYLEIKNKEFKCEKIQDMFSSELKKTLLNLENELFNASNKKIGDLMKGNLEGKHFSEEEKGELNKKLNKVLIKHTNEIKELKKELTTTVEEIFKIADEKDEKVLKEAVDKKKEKEPTKIFDKGKNPFEKIGVKVKETGKAFKKLIEKHEKEINKIKDTFVLTLETKKEKTETIKKIQKAREEIAKKIGCINMILKVYSGVKNKIKIGGFANISNIPGIEDTESKDYYYVKNENEKDLEEEKKQGIVLIRENIDRYNEELGRINTKYYEQLEKVKDFKIKIVEKEGKQILEKQLPKFEEITIDKNKYHDIERFNLLCKQKQARIKHVDERIQQLESKLSKITVGVKLTEIHTLCVKDNIPFLKDIKRNNTMVFIKEIHTNIIGANTEACKEHKKTSQNIQDYLDVTKKYLGNLNKHKKELQEFKILNGKENLVYLTDKDPKEPVIKYSYELIKKKE